MESSQRRSYTTQQREAVLADVRAVGVMAASEKHHVPQSCVSRWASAAGVKRGSGEKAPVAPRATEAPVAAEAPVGSATPAAKRTFRSRVAKIYSPSQKAVVLEDAAREGVTAAAKKHGISRFSIYDWQRRVTKAVT